MPIPVIRPTGASTTTTVTASSQAIAVPAGSSPYIYLAVVGTQTVFVALGLVGGTVTTSNGMGVAPGVPVIIKKVDANTHLAMIAANTGSTLTMTPVQVVA